MPLAKNARELLKGREEREKKIHLLARQLFALAKVFPNIGRSLGAFGPWRRGILHGSRRCRHLAKTCARHLIMELS